MTSISLTVDCKQILDDLDSSRAVKTYYQLLCQTGLDPSDFSQAITELAAKKLIAIDEEGSIMALATQPERLYSVFLDNGKFQATMVATSLTYEAAKKLGYALNQAVYNSGVETAPGVLFTVN